MDNQHPARCHHRQRAGGGQEPRDQLIATTARGRVARVKAFDVERPKRFVHDRREFAREIEPRLKIVAFEEIERRRVT